MAKTRTRRDRLSIDILPNEHKKIKIYAALQGKTIREYILESLREHLHYDIAEKGLSIMSDHLYRDDVLKELWDNKKDAVYDKL